ncbi:MAG: glycosyltransferase [Armatimonadia bacterium]
MNIAVVAPVFPALSETFVLSQITGLIDLGHDVRVISLSRPPAGDPVHPTVKDYGLLAKTTYLDLPRGRVAGMADWLLSMARLVARYGKRGWRAVAITRAAHGLPRPRDAAFADRMAPALQGCDVVYCHFGDVARRALPGALIVGAPLAVMFHGADLRRAQRQGPDAFGALPRLGGLFLAISDYSVRLLRELGFPPEKIRLHHVGIDTARFAAQPRVPGEDGTLRLLTVGRLAAVKGYEYGLRAVARLVDQPDAPTVQYTIIGDGPLADDLQALVRELGVEKEVVFRGGCAADRVLAELAAADLFMLPSVAEVTPVVLMEAQAAGLPVVATDVGAVREVVRDGRSGLIVPAGDAEALYGALAALLSKQDAWPQMGAAGREWVAQQYDAPTLNRRLSELLEELARPV